MPYNIFKGVFLEQFDLPSKKVKNKLLSNYLHKIANGKIWCFHRLSQ